MRNMASILRVLRILQFKEYFGEISKSKKCRSEIFAKCHEEAWKKHALILALEIKFKYFRTLFFSILVQDSCYQPIKLRNSDLFTKLIPTGACGEHGRCISTSFKDFYCDCNNGWKGERCQISA